MLKQFTFLFVLINFSVLLSAQNIEGKYDSQKQRFFTSDKKYQIDFFENGLAKIYKEGFVGLIDTTGKIILEIKYDAIYPYEGNIAKIGSKMKYGLIDKKGEVLIEPFASEIREFSNGIAVFRSHKKWDEGLIDEKGKIIAEAKYSFTGKFKEERITFRRDTIFGFMTPSGKEIIIEKDHDFLIDVISNRYDDFILTNKISNYINLFEFNEGLTTSYKKINGNFKFGCIDVNGKDKIAYEFDWIAPFKNGTANALKGGQWGLIDKTGKTILPFEYSTILGIDSNRFIISKKDKYGAVNSENTILLELKYPSLHHLFDDLLVTRDSVKFGVIDINGKQILPFKYEGIASEGTLGIASWYNSSFSLNTGIPRYHYYGSYFYFDKNGRIGKEEQSFSKLVEGISDWFVPGYLMEDPAFFTPVSYNTGPYGISKLDQAPAKTIEIKTSEELKHAKNYDYYVSLPGGYFVVGKMINDTIETVNLYPYTIIKNYKKGVIDLDGNLVLPLVYDDIRFEGKTQFIVQNEKKYGVVDLENELIVTIEYDHVKFISGAIVISKQIYTPFPYGEPGEMTYHWEHSLLDLEGKTIRGFSELDYRESLGGTWQEATSSSSNLINRKGEIFNPYE